MTPTLHECAAVATGFQYSVVDGAVKILRGHEYCDWRPTLCRDHACELALAIRADVYHYEHAVMTGNEDYSACSGIDDGIEAAFCSAVFQLAAKIGFDMLLQRNALLTKPKS